MKFIHTRQNLQRKMAILRVTSDAKKTAKKVSTTWRQRRERRQRRRVNFFTNAVCVCFFFGGVYRLQMAVICHNGPNIVLTWQNEVKGWSTNVVGFHDDTGNI